MTKNQNVLWVIGAIILALVYLVPAATNSIFFADSNYAQMGGSMQEKKALYTELASYECNQVPYNVTRSDQIVGRIHHLNIFMIEKAEELVAYKRREIAITSGELERLTSYAPEQQTAAKQARIGEIQQRNVVLQNEIAGLQEFINNIKAEGGSEMIVPNSKERCGQLPSITQEEQVSEEQPSSPTGMQTLAEPTTLEEKATTIIMQQSTASSNKLNAIYLIGGILALGGLYWFSFIRKG